MGMYRQRSVLNDGAVSIIIHLIGIIDILALPKCHSRWRFEQLILGSLEGLFRSPITVCSIKA